MTIKISEMFEFDKTTEKFVSKIKLDGQSCIISSEDNTEGKTTILRSIIFGLGFDVNKISEGYDKTSPIIKLNFFINDTLFSWKRELKNHNIIYQELPEKRMFNLDEENDIIAQTLGFQDYKFMNDFLGVIYIDQDFGWRTINHGRVHPEGKMKFNFPKLLSRIYENSSLANEEIENRINNLQDEKRAIKSILSSFKVGNVEKISTEKKLVLNELHKLSTNIKKYELMNKRSKRIPDELTKFLKLISNNEILKETVSKEKIKILKNMKEYELKLSKLEIERNTEFISKMKKRKKDLESTITKQMSFVDGDDGNIDAAIKNIIKFNSAIHKVSEESLSFKLEEINKRISNLKKCKKEIDKKNEEEFKQVFNLIENSLVSLVKVDLGVSEKIFMKWTQDSIFNEFSGAKKAFMVLLTRVIIHKEFYKKTKIKLPFIVDTLISFDPSDRSKDDLYKLLEIVNDSVSQLLIANVNKKINDELSEKIKKLKRLPPIKGEFKKGTQGQMSFEEFKF